MFADPVDISFRQEVRFVCFISYAVVDEFRSVKIAVSWLEMQNQLLSFWYRKIDGCS